MRREVRSALVTYTGGAALCLAVGLGLFVRARNLSAIAAMEHDSAAHVERLAARAGSAGAAAAIADLRGDRRVAAGFIVADVGGSARYPFLRERRYLAHTDARLAGAPVRDKEVYDLVAVTAREGAAGGRTPHVVVPAAPPPGARALLTAALALGGGRTAVVRLAPGPGPQPLPLGPGLFFLLGAVASAAAGTFLPRRRHLVAAVLAVGLAAYAFVGIMRPFGPVSTTAGLPALVATAVAALGLGWLGSRGVGARFFGALSEHRHAFSYAAPAMLGMGVLVLVPFVLGLALSFFFHRHGTYTFVGLRNFIEILSGGGHALSDPLNFYFTLGVTILWTFLNVFLHATIGLAMALVLRQPWLQLRGFYRVLLIVPWAVPNYITALIWKGMFHQQYGAVNHVLAAFGLTPISWFSSFATAFTANLVTNTWLGFPFMMVICLGALQSIPQDIYEAAEVDGASRWQQFVRLTLPLLRPALFPAIILGCIWTFNQFNIIYLVSGGEPGGATNILITEAYRWAFERGDRYGLAAAYAVLIFLVLLVWSHFTNRVSRGTEGVYE